jgi:hypothetical protein
MNAEGLHESWNLSCISVSSSLPNLAYRCKISTWSTKYMVSHHYKWRRWPGRGHHRTACCDRGALGRALSWLPGSRRCGSLDTSSSSDLGYSPWSLTSTGRDVSHRHRSTGVSIKVSGGHSLYHCPDMSLWFDVAPNTTGKHVGRRRWTLHAPKAPPEVYLSSRPFSLVCSSSCHWRSMWCAISFGIGTSGFPFACFYLDHHLIA